MATRLFCLWKLKRRVSNPRYKAAGCQPALHLFVAQVGVEQYVAQGAAVGEQQRLAFARLLLTKPLFAILDEATSALDSVNEASLYRQLAETHTTLISVGHRSTILKYHKQVLELTGDSDWRSHPAESFRFSK